jgi:serine/threonine transporter
VQDSTETALNSSTDVLFTAAACLAAGDVADSTPQLASNEA